MNRVSRLIIPLIVLVVLIGGVSIAFMRHDSMEQACATAVPAERIIAFGDSLVVGNGASIEGGFVTLLSRDLGIPVTNLGRSGDTTGQAKERLPEIIAMHPTITIVLLGGNDAIQHLPKEDTQKNLGEIIGILQKNGSKVILLGVIGGIPDPYQTMYESLAEAYKIEYVPNVLSGVFGHQDLMSDSVHPNQAGYQKVEDRILPVVQRACGE